MTGQTCGCPHHKMLPVFVVIFGLLFFLQSVEMISSELVSMLWPIIVMAVGVGKLTSGMCKCCGMK